MSDEVLAEPKLEIDGKTGDFHWKLSPEDRENLITLFNSGNWRTYRRILLAAKEGHNLQMLGMKDSHEIVKQLGIIVGLNLAVNQLGALVAQFNNQAKRVAEGSKNQPPPKGN